MPTRTIVVAGTHSGCGKTTASLGLMAALVRRGLTVQAFKCGPDFIDPGHHERITGRPSHNLDGWMMGHDAVQEVFAREAADADVAVVEGVMGLYDGRTGTGEDGSTAQIAKWLGAPVVLVADARSMARSAAALVTGYTAFDPDIDFAGILLNRVGSDNHAQLLDDALRGLPDHLGSQPPLLGLLRRREGLELPSRHLGLVTAQDHHLPEDTVTQLAQWMEDGCHLGRLLDRSPERHLTPTAPPTQAEKPVRIAVARDEAFCFYYHENLRQLEAAGAQLVFFSPLRDAALPPDIGGLYLGGGYPELHAAQLSGNAAMRAAVRGFSEANAPVYAECGGFMYLMRGITTAEGAEHPMVGVFPMHAAMDKRFRALGYREAVTTASTFFGPEWTMLRGHEFHYSSPSALDADIPAVYKVMDRRGWTGAKEGFALRQTLASYIHVHFASNPDAARAFVDAARAHTAQSAAE
ncbi:cobyrinate a,c-diamide synthase [Desulfobaculum sp.]